MPSLPVVSGTEVVRALQRLGFMVAPARQSHCSTTRVTGLRCANHRELKTGTLSGVLKQAGVSVDDFIPALKG